jgi:hypothetical protein
MIHAKAREGITGMVRALKGRWSSSQRWLREAVVWARSQPPQTWEADSSFVETLEEEGRELDHRAWQDTETHAFVASPSVAIPLDRLPTMDRYPGLDYSTSVIEPGGFADARKPDAVEVRGVYTVGDPRSLIVVGTLRSAAIGPVCSVRVAHWQDDTPMPEIDAFFGRLRTERGEHGRIELCLIEGCDGSFRTPAVVDHAWGLGVYPSYHSSVAPVFGIAADPQGNVYRGDSPTLKAFLEKRYAAGASHPGGCWHHRHD